MKDYLKQEVVLSVIQNRKSVRDFVPQKKVPKEDLITLMKAAMAAPSGKNRQPWAFIAVTERRLLDRLTEILPHGKMLASAGAAIVVCADMAQVLDGPGGDFWIQDCAAATQNILLATEALGLGAVWTGVTPYAFIGEENVAEAMGLLSIPEGVNILNVIAIGYPKGTETVKDKFKSEKIHFDTW